MANYKSPPEVLMQMVTGYWVSNLICVAAQLGIADLLKEESKSSDELAKITQADPRSLYRLLRALASVNIFEEVENKHFKLTSLGYYLQTHVPGSMRSLAMMFAQEWHWKPWQNIIYSLKTGDIAFKHIYGMTLFEYLNQNAEAAQVFNGAMDVMTTMCNAAILNSYDFSSLLKIVEVGGGHGSFIASILKAYPNMQGTLFDQPDVVTGAKNIIETEGLENRCKIVGGDFFELVPSGGDAYILKNVIHDWDDEQAIVILRNCYQAMVHEGELLLIETVIPPSNEPSFSKLLDLELVALTGGCERTEAEYERLLKAAGFQLTDIISTPSFLNVIKGVRVEVAHLS